MNGSSVFILLLSLSRLMNAWLSMACVCKARSLRSRRPNQHDVARLAQMQQRKNGRIGGEPAIPVGFAIDLDPRILQQAIKHAPGKRAVGAAALQGKGHNLLSNDPVASSLGWFRKVKRPALS